MTFNQSGTFIGGTTVRIYVGDKYSDGDLINIYYYEKDGERLESVTSAVAVKDGYLEFGVEKGTNYVVTMSDIPGIGTSNTDNKKNDDGDKGFDIVPLLVVLLIVMAIAAAAGWFMFSRSKKRPNDNLDSNPKPSNPKPYDSELVESKPSESKPSEPKPSELKTSDPKPSYSKPSYSKPSYSKPSYSKPSYSKPSAPKPSYSKPSDSDSGHDDHGHKEDNSSKRTFDDDLLQELSEETDYYYDD